MQGNIASLGGLYVWFSSAVFLSLRKALVVSQTVLNRIL